MAGSCPCVAPRALGMTGVASGRRQRRVAPASSRTLSALKAAAQVAAASSGLDFLAPALVSACGTLVRRYHAQQAQPSNSPLEVVWGSDADELLRHQRVLKTLFWHACRTRRAKPAKKLKENIAALILACETLSQDEAGWGARYLNARASALQVFAKVSNRRSWLMETCGVPPLQD